MTIEQNTNYAYKLKYMGNPNFDKVRDLAIKFMRELPKQLQDELYEALNRGVDILDSEPQMVTYLYAFGPMHQAKLNYAFKHLPEEFLEQPEINIIDYGCGQALGTMCYADFLRENGYSQKVKTITLIEPSEMCLKRAALHASVFFPDAEIKTVNKTFDELDENDICCDEDIPTLHILSNVLDILDFYIVGFANLIKDQLKGYNQFVCVGPYFNYSGKDERMDGFISLLDGKEKYREIFDKYEFDPDKAWTAQIQCFSAGKLPSTEASEDDVKKGIVDEFGAVYSIDGKRLLKCKNKDLESYYIKSGTCIICDYAFDGFSSLKQITIPDSVKSIGEGAFIDCSSLQQILIPDSVKCIDGGAFLNCSSLQQITIPDSVISFDNISFLGCLSLKQIRIPSSVTRIDQLGFCGCTSLQEITMSDSVTKIGIDAFEGCASLQQINIPNGRIAWFKSILDKKMWNKLVESSIDGGILSTEVTEEDIEDAVEDEYGVVYSRDDNRLLKCRNRNIELYNVRQGTRIICESAFMEIGTLKQIVIPDSVTDIEVQAFCGCKSLQKIDIPNSVTSIGYNAFGLCGSLQRINIPDSVSDIGPTAFHKCISLQQVIMPSSVTRIDYMTFCECTSLQQIVIPNTITIISDWAFSECKSLKQITISDSLSHIGTGAFAKCESLEQVVLPNSVHSIGNSAFEECKSLQQIIIQKGSTEKFKEMLDKELWDKLVECETL